MVGLGAGILIAIGLQQLLDAVGFSMPDTSLVLAGRTVWVALLGGTLITAIASVIPAVRAARIAPLAALQQSALGHPPRPVRTVGGAVLTVAGVVLVLVGLDRGVLSAVGAGAVATFVGVAMVAPLLGRPVVAALGAPVEATGASGMLARGNAARNPKRTATTASALMIGTALMAASFIMSRSITTSVERAISRGAVADLIVEGSNQLPFSGSLAAEVEQLDGISSVARVRVGQFLADGDQSELVALPAAAVEPGDPAQALDLGLREGDFTALPDGGIAVRDDVADDRGWGLGDRVPVTFPSGPGALTVVALFHERTIGGPYVVDLATYDANYAAPDDLLVLVNLADDGQLEQVKAEVAALIDASYPGLSVRDRAEYIDEVGDQVAQLTNLVTALLVLAVFIALLGVLITMLLSVSERTREIGLLRAVGMSRRQVRSMVRWEALIVALFGAVLGLALGGFFGVALVRALADQGITETVVPVVPLLVLAAVIAALGVITALYPARRAARMNVMLAVAST